MRAIRNLSNMQFHELKVLELADYKLQGQYVYKCQCSCGKICYVRSNRLTSGNTKSCGHLKSQILHQSSKKRINFQDQQIDDFLVDCYSHNDSKLHYAIWKCHCIYCNKIQYLASYQLKGHHNTKCSCRAEGASELCE